MAIRPLSKVWQMVQPYMPYALFAVVAIILLWSLLAPGFILTLDMVFTPRIPIPDQVTSSYVFYVVLHILNSFIPADLLQKVILLLILTCSGISMYQLAKYLVQTPDFSAPIIAGLVYMINPFVYSRFMAGQFAVLLGYACLPFFIKSFLRLTDTPSVRNAVWVAGWLTLIGILSIHTLALCGVVMIIGCAIIGLKNRKNRIKILQASLASVTFFVVASLYWLVPLVAGKNSTARAIEGFGGSDQAAFATVGSTTMEQMINIAGLQGFWADAMNLYVLPQQVLPMWPLVTLGIWVLVGYGYVRLRKSTSNKINLHIIIFAAIAAVIIAAGVLSPLLTLLPFAMGMREPHKFVGLVAVIFALLIGVSCAALVARSRELYHNRYASVVIFACTLLVPLAWTPTMLGGMHGQLKPRTYPGDWYAANNFLNADKSDFKALFLPWHGYQRFDFSGRIIMNPAEKFFDKPMLASNELEFRGAAPTFPDQTKSYITKTLLPQAPARRDLARKLNNITIKYIVVAHEDTGSGYLAHQPDVRLVFNTTKIKIYQNMLYKGRRT